MFHIRKMIIPAFNYGAIHLSIPYSRLYYWYFHETIIKFDCIKDLNTLKEEFPAA